MKILTAFFLSCAALILPGVALSAGPDPATENVMLVAKPEMGEFYKGTVLVVKPLPNGGHVGVIVNRPTPATLGKLYPEHAPSQKVTGPVYLGGPVGTDSVMALVKRVVVPSKGAIPFVGDTSLVLLADEVDKVIEADGDNARYIVGAVLWQPGELDGELKKGFWFVQEVDTSVLFMKSTEGLWEERVKKSGDTPLPVGPGQQAT